MDAALRLATLVVRLLEFEQRSITGMSAAEIEQMSDCKEELHVLAASILEREDRWILTPLRLFDSSDN